MSRLLIIALAGVFAFAAPLAGQDDDKFRPGRRDEGDDMTPQQAMELLREAQDLMTTVEELLNDMKTVEKMMDKTLEKQKSIIDKLAEIIKKARMQMSDSQKPKPGQPGSQARPNNPGSPATKPYDPGRTSPPSKFRSKGDKTGAWGKLPPRLRDAMLHGRRSIDEYPAEFREVLKEYMKKLAESEP